MISNLSLSLESLYINCSPKDKLIFDKLDLLSEITKLKLPYYARMPDLKESIIKKLSDLNYVLKIQSSIDSNFKISAVLDKTGVCVQFGNIANLAMDILKINDCFNNGIVEKAIIFLPTQSTEKIFGTSNCATLERIGSKKSFFSRHIHLPCCIFGVSANGENNDL